MFRLMRERCIKTAKVDVQVCLWFIEVTDLMIKLELTSSPISTFNYIALREARR